MNLFIDSPANSRIKELVKLRESPRRRKDRGMFFVEGKSELQFLVKAGRVISEIYYSLPDIDETREDDETLEFKNAGIQIIKVSPAAFAKASYRSSEHGWIGMVSTWDIELEKIHFPDAGPIVVLDEVEKPVYLGSILRSVV
jgi:TrmH family RNA methyltransferase